MKQMIIQFNSKLSNRIRNNLLRLSFKSIGNGANISRKAIVYGASNISIGKNTTIFSNAVLSCSKWDRTRQGLGIINIGDNCDIQPYACLLAYGGHIKIGDYCSVNPFTILYGHGGLTIGNHVRIASNSTIIPGNHKYEDPHTPIMYQGISMKGITIEDDVWIGSGVRILDGVIIKKGCVIGLGSVVSKSTEPFGVYVGNPAIRIRDRK
jgi:acetyltransferase-like isoleucine patch superfamily enzyme